MNKSFTQDPMPLHTDLISTTEWARQIGRCSVTLWRWAGLGWLHPVNISGRSYLTREDIEQFVLRAKAGEFQKAPKGAAKQKAVVL